LDGAALRLGMELFHEIGAAFVTAAFAPQPSHRNVTRLLSFRLGKVRERG
jgi:hypothetical protein